jgi:Pin2-interacting protein X1
MGDVVVRARSKKLSAAIGTGSLSTEDLEPASSSTTSFAQRHLEKMGWSAGTGLGKKRNGVTTHIVVQKREDSVGLGSDKEAAALKIREQSSEWWKDALGDTLAKLGGAANQKASSKRKSSSSSSKRKTVTDADLFQATGGARFGMRAGKTRNLAKWRRTETNDEDEPVVVGTVNAKAATDGSPTKKKSKKEYSKVDLGDSLKGEKSKKDRVAKRDKKKKSRLEQKAKPTS